MTRQALSSRGHAQIHFFADSEGFARQLGETANLECLPIDVHRFPDGESLVRVNGPVGREAFVVRTLNNPNVKLVETVLAADGLRRAGARRVTLVAPYLPYMRQDAVFRSGEPISQQVLGAWLSPAFDRVLTVEAHLHRIRRLSEVMSRGSRSISAAPAIADWLKRSRDVTLVVGPDDESSTWVRAIGRAAGLEWMVGGKERHGDDRVTVTFPSKALRGRAVIVDDIASSGATLAVAARALRRAGASAVDAIVVHAIFAPGALARIRAAGVQRIISTDTIPHPTNGIGVASLLAPSLAGGRR